MFFPDFLNTHISTPLIASAAELVIPSVSPEPSPIGNKFLMFIDSKLSLRTILAGDDVLVSGARDIKLKE